MEKEIRNAIEKVTQRSRKLLEEDFAEELEGTYDVLRSGSVALKGGVHLTERQHLLRAKIVAVIEHKCAAGMKPGEAVMDYIRDAAFTALNRFVALKMLEARELVQECITKGDQSSGYKEFCGLAPGVALLPDNAGYRLYIESLFDELSTEIKVLFDRRDPDSVLWPRRKTFETLLSVLVRRLGGVIIRRGGPVPRYPLAFMTAKPGPEPSERGGGCGGALRRVGMAGQVRQGHYLI